MTFHRKDPAAYGADAPLSTSLLQDLHDGAKAAYEGRGRRACWSFDVRAAPRACSLRGASLPLPWRLSWGCSGLTVKVRAKVQQQPVELSLRVRDLDDLARPLLETPADTDSKSASASVQTYTLTLTAQDLARYSLQEFPAERDLCLWLGFKSSKGAYVSYGAATSWTRWSVKSAVGLVVEGIPAAALKLVRTPLMGGAAVAPPDGYPLEAQVLRQWNSGGREEAYLFPPPGNTYVSGVGVWVDTINYAQLGYAEIYSITVEETAFLDVAPRGSSLNAGRLPAARAVRRIYGVARQTYTRRGHVYRLGPSRPQEQAAQQDGSAPAVNSWNAPAVGTGDAPLNQTRPEVLVVSGTNTYQPDDPVSAGDFEGISWARYHRPTSFVDQDDSAAGDQARTATECLALVSVSTYSEGGVFGIRARQRNDAAATPEGQIVTTEANAARHINDDPDADLAGYLLHFVDQPDSGSIANQCLHALRGFIDDRLLPLYQLRALRLADVWDWGASPAVLVLDLQLSDSPLDGGRQTDTATDRRLHLHGCVWLEGEGELPEELGQP